MTTQNNPRLPRSSGSTLAMLAIGVAAMAGSVAVAAAAPESARDALGVINGVAVAAITATAASRRQPPPQPTKLPLTSDDRGNETV